MTTTTSQAEPGKEAANTVPRDTLRLVSIGLGIIGLLVTIYLVYTHATNTQQVCLEGGGFNCDLVQGSIYSRIGPVPIQYLGLAGYLGILAVLLLESRIPLLTTRGKIIVFAMTLFGFLYSMYLTTIEAFVIHAWCMWCLTNAITMTLLFGVSSARLWRSISDTSEDFDIEEA